MANDSPNDEKSDDNSRPSEIEIQSSESEHIEAASSDVISATVQENAVGHTAVTIEENATQNETSNEVEHQDEVDGSRVIATENTSRRSHHRSNRPCGVRRRSRNRQRANMMSR